MNCLNCGKPCEPDFSTCSKECNVAYREDTIEKRRERLKEKSHLLGTQQLADALGVSLQTIYGWTRRGKIPFDRSAGPRSTRYDLEEVRKAIGQYSEAQLSEEPPQPSLDQPKEEMSTVQPRARESTVEKTDLSRIGDTIREFGRDLVIEACDKMQPEMAYQTIKKWFQIDGEIQKIFSSGS